MQLAKLPQLYFHVEPCFIIDLLALQLLSKLGLGPSATHSEG